MNIQAQISHSEINTMSVILLLTNKVFYACTKQPYDFISYRKYNSGRLQEVKKIWEDIIVTVYRHGQDIVLLSLKE